MSPRVVVPRAAQQAGALSVLLRAAGIEAVEVPVIAIEEALDGGAALAAAVRDGRYDWVVVTSTNAARRIPVSGLSGAKVAAVGPGTAEVLRSSGLAVDLVPARNVAEGLLEEMPDGPGRVLLPQGERARPVLAEGLRSKGWEVDAVVAYRTLPVAPSRELLAVARGADGIAFTSASTVTSYIAAAGVDAVPGAVVCIGPVTAEAAADAGLSVAAVAEPHTLEGLVAAVKAAIGS